MRLQRVGTLPEVWIPPGELRDARELPRARMALVQQRTRLKNRIHATLSAYGIWITDVSDLFGKRGRTLVEERLRELPPHTAFVTSRLLEQVGGLDREIQVFQQRMGELFEVDDQIQLLTTLPGVGFILAVVIRTEIGDVGRFARSEQLAAYAGTVPRVQASGERRRYRPLRSDVNHYLKWAFVEAANAVVRVRRRHLQRHVTQLYERLARRRGHQKAIGAVARHLAEAAYWVLATGKAYREPGSSTEA